MERLADAIDRPLHWSQPRSFQRTFELRAGETLVATLVFPSTWETLATARTAESTWTLQRNGWCRPQSTVRREGHSDNLAVFESRIWSSGGTLTCRDGRTIEVITNFWQTKIEFVSGRDDVLFRYHTEGTLRCEARVEWTPAGRGFDEWPWLLCFGWYLVVNMYNDAANATI